MLRSYLQAREKGIAALNRLQQFRLLRMDKHPVASILIYRVFFPKLLHKPGLDPSGERRCSLPPRVMEKMAEDHGH